MSGPKQSFLSIRRQLAAQMRQQKELKLEKARNKLIFAKEDFQNALQKLRQLTEYFKETESIKDVSEFESESIKKIKNEFAEKALKIDIKAEKKVDLIIEKTLYINNEIQKLCIDYDKEIQTEFSAFKEISLIKEESTAFLKTFEEMQRCKNEQQKNAVFIKNTSVNPEEILKEFEKCFDSFFISAGHKKAVQTMTVDIKKHIEKDDINELNKLISLSIATIEKIKTESILFEKKYAEYETLGAELGSSLIHQSTFLSLEELNELIENLKEKIFKKEESEYILSSVSEAMSELGYNVLSSDILKQGGTSVKRAIYSFDEDSVINSYVSESGALMLEIANLSDNEQPSEEEKDSAYENMLNFCKKYPEIEEKLLEKGVIIENKNYLPPSRDFAKNISMNSSENKVESFRKLNKNKNKKNNL